jgi:hypothetical protein
MAPAASPCASPASGIVHAVRDAWIPFPDTVFVGREWRDTVTIASCRDGIPLTTMASHVFRVLAAESRAGQDVLTVERTATTDTRGSGRQSREPVTFASSGSGVLTYVVEAATGEVLSGSGSAASTMTLSSAVRSQAVRQTTNVRVLRLP